MTAEPPTSAVSRWRRSLGRLWARRSLAGEVRDTLERLLRGGFADLEPADRRRRVEQIVGVCASAAAASAAAPLPFLDLPVQGAMVGAIARVHGIPGSPRRLLAPIVAGLGGALLVNQALRLVPFGGLSRASRAYGATWALGRVCDLYFEQGRDVPSEEMRRVFRDTMTEKSGLGAQPADPAAFAARLVELDDLLRRGEITIGEYAARRELLLEDS